MQAPRGRKRGLDDEDFVSGSRLEGSEYRPYQVRYIPKGPVKRANITGVYQKNTTATEQDDESEQPRYTEDSTGQEGINPTDLDIFEQFFRHAQLTRDRISDMLKGLQKAVQQSDGSTDSLASIDKLATAIRDYNDCAYEALVDDCSPSELMDNVMLDLFD